MNYILKNVWNVIVCGACGVDSLNTSSQCPKVIPPTYNGMNKSGLNTSGLNTSGLNTSAVSQHNTTTEGTTAALNRTFEKNTTSSSKDCDS